MDSLGNFTNFIIDLQFFGSFSSNFH